MNKESEWQTKRWVIHSGGDNSVDKLIRNPQIIEAAEWIVRDEVVAFPTETVYGLGANALSDKASQKIFQAKGRPSDNPLIVHIACVEQLDGLVDNLPELGQKLMHAFWPGPLTMVLPQGNKVCSTVTAGLSTVAVRMPAHPIALALIRASAKPLAAPSANRSGKPSPTSADHVWHDLQGRIVGLVDGGKTGVGLESTVVDVTGKQAIILRPGGITKDQLEEVVGNVAVDPALLEGEGKHQLFWKPRSPGVKYTHYAPEATMCLVSHQHGLQKMRSHIQELVYQEQRKGYRVGVLTTEEGKDFYQADTVISLGFRDDLASIAQHMYAALRWCDQQGVDAIYAESFPEEGLGEAIMNRLLKAAGGRIII